MAEAERKKEIDIEIKRQALIEAIRAQAEICNKLLNLGYACVINGIHLGNVDYQRHLAFVTNGITHKFGFFIKNPSYMIHSNNASAMIGGLPDGLGYAGGGWNGDDFKVDKNGEIIVGANHPRFMTLANDFLRDINKFEKEFYNYIDALEV